MNMELARQINSRMPVRSVLHVNGCLSAVTDKRLYGCTSQRTGEPTAVCPAETNMTARIIRRMSKVTGVFRIIFKQLSVNPRQIDANRCQPSETLILPRFLYLTLHRILTVQPDGWLENRINEHANDCKMKRIIKRTGRHTDDCKIKWIIAKTGKQPTGCNFKQKYEDETDPAYKPPIADFVGPACERSVIRCNGQTAVHRDGQTNRRLYVPPATGTVNRTVLRTDVQQTVSNRKLNNN
jgi:hypothetical protein